MRIAEMNWAMVEKRLQQDDRCVLPLGATEQHAHLSLCVDALLSERIAVEAAEPLGVPVFPAVPYGPTPEFAAFPGTITLRLETMLAVVRDIVRSVHRTGFRRLLIVNGHGGNDSAGILAYELMDELPQMAIKFHNWYSAPATWAAALRIAPNGSHANWFESFPWTRLAGVDSPIGEKAMVERTRLCGATPEQVREIIGDGSYGGSYQKPDEAMLALWRTGVEEVRAALERPWPETK